MNTSIAYGNGVQSLSGVSRHRHSPEYLWLAVDRPRTTTTIGGHGYSDDH